MVSYLLWKETYFRSECAGVHVNSETKYHCEIQGAITHPCTDTNPPRLFRKIASFYKYGDELTTIGNSSINRDSSQVTLTEPLSSDELKMLAIEVMDALVEKNKGSQTNKIPPADESSTLDQLA